MKYGKTIFDTERCKIVKFLDEENSSYQVDPVVFALSVDPLTKSYPMLTPYQFASNTPIMAIDLDGLEAFVIHGTRQEGTGLKLSIATKDELLRIAGNTVIDDGFRWNSHITNNHFSRNKAANKLASYIARTRHELLKAHKITKDEPISIIGYSHGGNVGVHLTQKLGKLGVKANLITISTPAYNTSEQDAYGGGLDSEDPRGSNGINAHIQIVHENDNVVDKGAMGNETYTTDNNYVITNDQIKLDGGIESHTDLPSHDKFDDVLKTIPAMKKAPKPVNLDKVIEKDPALK